jgi:hypothetical protein
MIRSALLSPAVGLTLLALSAGPAAAQGTMTPSQPPPDPAGAPTEPPPLPPAQPVAPAEPTVIAPGGARPEPGSIGEPVPEEERGAAPKAHTGFQVAVRTGVTVPFGSVQKDVKMSDELGVQLPLFADVGVKIIPQLFIGGYVGISVGAVGDTVSSACDRLTVSCSSIGGRIGLQAQYHVLPDGKVNPWIGYGIGYEIAGASGSRADNKFSAALGGVEFAHFMAGADFRISKVVGLGPFADFALGQYSISSVEQTRFGQTLKSDGDINDKALHEWLTLGVKVTFFP